MNVIRHDHVTTNGDVEARFGTFGKNGERRMNFVASEKRFSLVSAKSDEIQGPIIKDAAQTWRPSLEIRFHTKHVATACGLPMQNSSFMSDRYCSHGPVGRTFF